MEKEFLKSCLDQGMSLEEIGVLVDRHPSTVSYHLQKHGLEPVGREAHAPTGKVDPDNLRTLVEEGASIRTMAAELGVGYSTVRYWLNRLGLKSRARQRRNEVAMARADGGSSIVMVCDRHGETTFAPRSDGSGYLCLKCRSEAVTRWRKRLKQLLVDEAGGVCVLCGYDRNPAGLHFHHIDPATKLFGISERGLTRSTADARAEAQKCVLLCGNCHAEVEAGVTEIPDSCR